MNWGVTMRRKGRRALDMHTYESFVTNVYEDEQTTRVRNMKS